MCQKELKSTDWQRNLKIAWIGTFFTGASFSIVMPFMALYIEELGVKGDMVEWYTGLSVAISALASALVSPIWGRLADRYGRKPMMIRASMVMTFTMGGLGDRRLNGRIRGRWHAPGDLLQPVRIPSSRSQTPLP